MLLVAIAGPYRATTEWGVVENIRRAEEAALAIWRLGVAAICPHKNTAFFGGAAPDGIWLEGALEMVRRSDALLAINGWENSIGAKNEVSFAQSSGIPVFFCIEEFSRWLASQG